MTRSPKVTIVGASAAGLSVAETLRRDGFDGRITMIGEEEHPPYDRPPLSKEVLAGAWPDDRVRLREESALSGLDLDIRLGVRATGLDTDSRTIQLSAGSPVHYDDLVITTGTRARHLPGTENVSGVHVLRTLADAQHLRAALAGYPKLVIVGAGFLGAEVASVASEAGADVTLVSDIEAPLANVLGPELSRLLVDVHAEHGVRMHSGVGVDRVLTSDGRATGVLLADGTTVDADVVLVSIGSIPNTEWLAGSGIEVDDGVRCDEYCRAGPGVWAAGDVASWHHTSFGERLRVEHRTNAAEQGMAVARNILAVDHPTSFTPVPYIWSDQYDLKIQIYGLPRAADRFAVTDGDIDERALVALYGKDDIVRAAVGINKVRAARNARALLTRRTPWQDIEEEGAA